MTFTSWKLKLLKTPVKLYRQKCIYASFLVACYKEQDLGDIPLKKYSAIV